MIFKVMSMRKDENGDSPVYSSFIEECYRIDWREEKLNNGKHYLLFTLYISPELSRDYMFELNRKDSREIIFIENETGKTIERFNTYRK